MLLQEEANTSGREGGLDLHGARDHGIEIEILDRLQRTPDFFPPACVRRGVQHVDECSLQPRYTDTSTGVTLLDDADVSGSNPTKRTRHLDRQKLQIAEFKRAAAGFSQKMEPSPDRIGVSPELQGGVIRDRRVGG